MLYHPLIVELIMKERQRDLLAEAHRIHLAQAVEAKESPIVSLIEHMILFLANVLIKAGTSMKDHWLSWRLSHEPINGDARTL